MSDYALIEAMALAMLKSGYSSFWSADDLKGMAHHALAVCRPIIERETRERCAKIAEITYVKDAFRFELGTAIAAAIRETGE